ncbi:hypothetical protein BRYFOR_09892 [Marvinbryantia formatexigens DSM 14469]|uniref:Uncharacterized protein n=1 Tax=Marvinbryantia formatexigens DSM 14469 TaxID=478749 RepID=C6LMJ1_9FIRM|nr:hypothetical protein BRYFOR_09892 [Marvinbryantia formatexigens DSM 14469]
MIGTSKGRSIQRGTPSFSAREIPKGRRNCSGGMRAGAGKGGTVIVIAGCMDRKMYFGRSL